MDRDSRPTFFEQICKTSASQPNTDALVSDDCAVTYGELPRIVTHYAECLQQAGIRPVTTVGVRIPADIPHILVALALLKMKCSQATLTSADSASHNEAFAGRLNVASIVSMKPRADLIHPSPEDFVVTHREYDEAKTSTNYRPIVYLTTSGTTKEARIIPLTEENLASNGVHWRTLPGRRTLWLASVEQNLGKKARLMDIYSGYTSASMSKGPRSWSNITKFVSDKEIDHFYLPILDISAFTRSVERHLDPKVALSTGGTRIPWPVRQRIFETMTKNLHILYGLTEIYMIAVAGPDDHDERETVGKPNKDMKVEVVDTTGKPVATGEIGELRIKAEGMIDGYYDDPVETAAKFRDGWFYPGDLGSMTDDGRLIIHGRADDMMIMNGINIYPGEVERAFDVHPDVAAAAAFPVKSRIHGEIPVVALELNKGSQLTEADFLAYAREKLGIRGPRKIMLLDRLPRNALGKVLKTELAAKLNRTNDRNKI